MLRPSTKAIRRALLIVCLVSYPLALASAQTPPATPAAGGPAVESSLPAAELVLASLEQEPEPPEEEAPEEDEDLASDVAGFLEDLDIGGEVSVAYTYAFDSDSRLLFGRVFDNVSDQFTLHQAELWVERASSVDAPFGFNIDITAGDDAEKIHALGLGESGDSFDLTQAFVSYQVGEGLQLKAGKFVTLHGAEYIRRSLNFMHSRSLLFGFAIPFTHTGLLATWTGDAVTLTGGIVNGWDNVDDQNDDKTFHGMIGFTPSDAVAFTVGGTYGAEQAASSAKRTLIDALLTLKPADGLTIMLNYDWAEEEDLVVDPVTDALSDAEWDGLAGYVLYDFTDVFSLGARAEYFNDDDGVRLGAGPLELWEGTLTARFKVRENLITSIEYRHDESSDKDLVFDGGTDDAQDTIAIEIVGTF